MSATSDRVRKMFGEGDTLRDAGLTMPDNIERYDDICYGTDSKWQMLDVYRPKEKQGELLPVLINVHGGAWVYGDKERYQYYCMSLAQQGFAVVNFSYRLAPEYKFPAPVEDMNQVIHWIFAHKKEYGFDMEHIFAVGDSAGANLLNLYTMICINPEYAKKYDIKTPQGFKPNAVALNCGAYIVKVNDDPNDLTSCLMKDYLPHGGSREELEMVNALPYMTEEYPPAFVMTANEDFLRSEAPVMVKRLQELQILHEFRLYGNEEHPLQHVFHCNIKLEEARKCNMEECAFFQRFLG
ncbi:MAG: alpha/beta hydrolase [Hespellia sp.]|nr:alpha/beta hydrolase [Hespellia sp.]